MAVYKQNACTHTRVYMHTHAQPILTPRDTGQLPYADTHSCANVFTLACRLPAFLSVSLCWRWGQEYNV